MNRDDILRIAEKAGFADGVVDIIGLDGFANFANLVAAAEREACALTVEQAGIDGMGTLAAAAAIRARGEK